VNEEKSFLKQFYTKNLLIAVIAILALKISTTSDQA